MVGPTTANPDIEITVFTSSTGIPIAGQEVTISAIGYIRNQSLMGITTVNYGFRNSYAYPPQNTNEGFPVDYNATLYNDGTGRLTGAPAAIYFPTAGDYNPVFNFYIPEIHMIYPIEYQHSTINVAPASELITEKTNNVNSALSIALFYFGLIEAIPLAYKLVRRTSRKTEIKD